MGVVDDDRIRVRYVDAILDDGGSHKHVVFVIHEVQDDPFQFVRLHLAVSDGHAHSGHLTPNQVLDLVNVLNAIVDEKDLPVATHLKFDGLTNNVGVEALQFRLHRVSVGRRRSDVAQVAGSHE